MTFIPNYKKLGLNSSMEAWVHVMTYLKKQEANILKLGLSNVNHCSFILGCNIFSLGDTSSSNFEKPKKQKKS